jgi:hypothetical protein
MPMNKLSLYKIMTSSSAGLVSISAKMVFILCRVREKQDLLILL